MPTNHKLPNQRFYTHRSNAKRRNIPFLLSFDEWWKIWQDSGKWTQCGKGKGKYCMARPGDQGAYEIGNVRICLNEENRAEVKPMVGERNPMYGKSVWDRHTPEQRAKHLAAVVKRNKQPVSLATRAKMSANAKGRKMPAAHRARVSAAFKGRHWVMREGRRAWLSPGDADYPGGAI